MSRQSGSGGGGVRFGVVLGAHRRAAGLTQQQLADLAEVSVGTLRDLEQGRTRYPRPGPAARLAAALGLDASQAEQLPQQARVQAARVQEGAAVVRHRQRVAWPAAAGGVWVQVLGPLVAWRGLHERVLPHLEAVIQREPLNEQAHAQLMLALAGSGQQAAALQLFEELRHRLDDQLGVRPGPELADAHLRVLRQEVPAAAASSSALVPIPVTTAAVTTTAVLTQTVLPVCQLLPDVADFTGRAGDCARLAVLLAAAADTDTGTTAVPVGVISGPPGAGKTTLALHLAHALRSAFPDGQLFVPLAGSSRPRRPGAVLDELLRALGVAPGAIPETAGQRAALFRSRLAGRRVLVVVDDAGSPGQVRPLLPGTAGCAVIVTSRNRLAGLGGGWMRWRWTTWRCGPAWRPAIGRLTGGPGGRFAG